MKTFTSLIGAIVVALTTFGAAAQMLTLGAGSTGGGGACVGLFAPNQLPAGQYQVVLDGSTVAWSGSNFGTTANAGSLGGNIVADVSTVSKGTQLNGFDTLAFTFSNSLKIASLNWSGDVYVFGVFGSIAAPSGAQANAVVTMGWGSTTNPSNATSGWVVYPRSGFNSNALVGHASGFNTTQIATAAQVITDLNQHIQSYQMGSANGYRMDGSAVTLSANNTISPTSLTSMPLNFAIDGDHSANNEGSWSVAYLLIGSPPSAGNIQKLEGWAAWRFGLTANLPGGHPYKSAAPPC